MANLTFRIGYQLNALPLLGTSARWTNHAMVVDAKDVDEAQRKVEKCVPAGCQVRWTRCSVRCTAQVPNRRGTAGHGNRWCGRWVADGSTRCTQHAEPAEPGTVRQEKPAACPTCNGVLAALIVREVREPLAIAHLYVHAEAERQKLLAVLERAARMPRDSGAGLVQQVCSAGLQQSRDRAERRAR